MLSCTLEIRQVSLFSIASIASPLLWSPSSALTVFASFSEAQFFDATKNIRFVQESQYWQSHIYKSTAFPNWEFCIVNGVKTLH